MDKIEAELGLSWDWHYVMDSPETRSALPIVGLALDRLTGVAGVLYVGLGDGRNAFPLLCAGIDLWACDVSREAVDRAVSIHPEWSSRFEFASGDSAFCGRSPFGGLVISRTLVGGDLARTEKKLSDVCGRVVQGGCVVMEIPAIGTDLWPDWVTAEIDQWGCLAVAYPGSLLPKLYLSFNALGDMLEAVGLMPEYGPIPVDLPRKSYPGGIVRDWLVAARKVSP